MTRACKVYNNKLVTQGSTTFAARKHAWWVASTGCPSVYRCIENVVPPVPSVRKTDTYTARLHRCTTNTPWRERQRLSTMTAINISHDKSGYQCIREPLVIESRHSNQLYTLIAVREVPPCAASNITFTQRYQTDGPM